MVVQFKQIKDHPERIILKFLDGPRADENFTFSKNSQIIKAGRNNKCDITFNDTALSRIQFM